MGAAVVGVGSNLNAKPSRHGRSKATRHESNWSITSSGYKHNWSVQGALETCKVVQRCSAAPPPQAALAPAVLEQRLPMTRTMPLPGFVERPRVQSPQAPAVLGPGSNSWARTVGKICGCRCLHPKVANAIFKALHTCRVIEGNAAQQFASLHDAARTLF